MCVRACVCVCVTVCDIYMCQKQVEANQYLPTMDLIWGEGCDVRWTYRPFENTHKHIDIFTHLSHHYKNHFVNHSEIVWGLKMFLFHYGSPISELVGSKIHFSDWCIQATVPWLVLLSVSYVCYSWWLGWFGQIKPFYGGTYQWLFVFLSHESKGFWGWDWKINMILDKNP